MIGLDLAGNHHHHLASSETDTGLGLSLGLAGTIIIIIIINIMSSIQMVVWYSDHHLNTKFSLVFTLHSNNKQSVIGQPR